MDPRPSCILVLHCGNYNMREGITRGKKMEHKKSEGGPSLIVGLCDPILLGANPCPCPLQPWNDERKDKAVEDRDMPSGMGWQGVGWQGEGCLMNDRSPQKGQRSGKRQK